MREIMGGSYSGSSNFEVCDLLCHQRIDEGRGLQISVPGTFEGIQQEQELQQARGLDS